MQLQCACVPFNWLPGWILFWPHTKILRSFGSMAAQLHDWLGWISFVWLPTIDKAVRPEVDLCGTWQETGILEIHGWPPCANGLHSYYQWWMTKGNISVECHNSLRAKLKTNWVDTWQLRLVGGVNRSVYNNNNNNNNNNFIYFSMDLAKQNHFNNTNWGEYRSPWTTTNQIKNQSEYPGKNFSAE